MHHLWMNAISCTCFKLRLHWQVQSIQLQMCAVNEGLTEKKDKELSVTIHFSSEVLFSSSIRLCILFGSPQRSRGTVGMTLFLFFASLCLTSSTEWSTLLFTTLGLIRLLESSLSTPAYQSLFLHVLPPQMASKQRERSKVHEGSCFGVPPKKELKG